MKRYLLLLSFVICNVVAGFAQSDFQKAVTRYKNVKLVTAVVSKTAHKNALANDVVTKGTSEMKAPAEVSIIMEGGKDQLLMQGSTFTMVVKGKKHTTNSGKNTQFVSFQAVFESILSGGTKDISKLDDMTIDKRSGMLVLTITPKAASKKAARRMLFSSIVITIDPKTSEVKSLRMNERGGYTEYTFSGYKFK